MDDFFDWLDGLLGPAPDELAMKQQAQEQFIRYKLGEQRQTRTPSAEEMGARQTMESLTQPTDQ